MPGRGGGGGRRKSRTARGAIDAPGAINAPGGGCLGGGLGRLGLRRGALLLVLVLLAGGAAAAGAGGSEQPESPEWIPASSMCSMIPPI